MKTFSGKKASQKQKELNGMIKTIVDNDCKTYLEIGARHGDTFYEVVKRLPKGSLVVAVDLPGGTWGVGSSVYDLNKAAKALNEMGYNVAVVLGDSTNEDIIKQIRQISPSYDAILIDGDHRYAGVKKDWENYFPMANKVVFFHDIDGHGVRQKSNPQLVVEVPKLWEEIKTNHKHVEFIDKEDQPDRPMGIGGIFI